MDPDAGTRLDSLGEDLVLLSVTPDAGWIGTAQRIGFGLMGSELVRLAAAGRIHIAANRIIVQDPAPWQRLWKQLTTLRPMAALTRTATIEPLVAAGPGRPWCGCRRLAGRALPRHRKRPGGKVPHRCSGPVIARAGRQGSGCHPDPR